MPARTFGKPIADQLGLVARGVVHDNVDVEISRHILFDLVEELAELARAMARHAFCDDLADLDVERCEERRGAVALVVMRASLDLAGAHRHVEGVTPSSVPRLRPATHAARHAAGLVDAITQLDKD